MVKPLFSGRSNPERSERFSALQEGVPDFLFPSLLDWTLEHFLAGLAGMRIIDEQMILRLERRARRALPTRAKTDLNALVRAFEDDTALLLDAIDFVLSQEHFYGHGNYNLDQLESILEDAGSAYCVGTDEDDNLELQFRQSEELTELFRTEADQPGRAAEHLRRAWSKCFHRDRDPNKACSEAVSAVEAAAKPVISPNNQRTTLGTLLRDMKPEPDKEPGYKWETDSEFDSSMETVFSMMQLVWNKGHYRHGDDSLPLEVSRESAEMTVQTAVLLVNWFRSERIRLKQ